MSAALSIRQPWAWLILNAGKDIENRNWSTNFRGTVLIHASKGCTKSEFEDAQECAEMIGIDTSNMPGWKQIERGGIVGSVEIVDCVTKSQSPWFYGDFGFVLRNASPLPFRPWKGQLGFFNVSLGEKPWIVTCDCLNWCGDDPWLRTGKAQPCKKFLDRQHQEAVLQKKQDAATTLCQKFGVTNLLDLIEAQDTHIQRLEATA